MRPPRHLLALFALGLVVLLLAVADVDTPVRPVLTLLFFALGPGAVVVPHLGVRADALMEASLAIGISVAVSMAVAQTMVWAGLFSPLAAVLAMLAFMAVAAPPRRAPSTQEVAR
ncbi:MAG: hypothetical protein ACRD2W_04970 [Acidimicrobiales bacterium]